VNNVVDFDFDRPPPRVGPTTTVGTPQADGEARRKRATTKDQPARRPIRIYSFDPMLANTLERTGPATVTVGIPWEPLEPGPAGARVQVIDFDGGRTVDNKPAAVFYEPINLDEPNIAVQGGLAPTERDPRFHQQMTYAVAMRTLEAFDKALGRIVRPKGGYLRMFPHAFRGENAYYDPELRAVLFGYFEASRTSKGANLPGQPVFTCLSHDIISHEVTHALIHRLRPQLLDGTNADVGAFHEAIADLTAVFLHFTLPGVVDQTLATSRSKLSNAYPLLQLAQQFGYATGRGSSLRGAGEPPDPERLATELEPHARGSFLVSAVLDAFTTSYQRRIADLLRIATGGTGILPRGALHPDLVARISREAIRSSDQVLTVCLRAIDYLPPVDVTFSDYLRAIVTADRELFPTDAGGLRTAFVDGFRRRGILPEGVLSLAEDALSWLPFEPGEGADVILPDWLREQVLALDTQTLNPTEAWNVDEDLTSSMIEAYRPMSQDTRPTIKPGLEAVLTRELRPRLDLHPDIEPQVRTFQTMIRADEDGAPHVGFVVEVDQKGDPNEFPDLDDHLVESSFRRGTTLIFDQSGRLRYSISKPLPGPGLSEAAKTRAKARADSLRGWLDEDRTRDPGAAFGIGPEEGNRFKLNFALLHGGLP
jgi:hypothetical protein